MEKIIEKLEKIIGGYLDEIENKPVKTIIITILIYYLFKSMKRRG